MPIRVVFEPDNLTVEGHEATGCWISRRRRGFRCSRSAAGRASAGGCRVVVQSGRIASPETGEVEEITSPREVLACATTAAGDLVIHVPPEVRLATPQPEDGGYLAPSALALLGPTRRGLPLAQRVSVQLAPPSADDPSGDWERLMAGLAALLPEPRTLRADLELLRQLPGQLRERDFAVTADLVDEGCQVHVLALGGPGQPEPLGVAVDIGTTNVKAQSVNLHDGAVLGAAAQLIARGATARTSSRASSGARSTRRAARSCSARCGRRLTG